MFDAYTLLSNGAAKKKKERKKELASYSKVK